MNNSCNIRIILCCILCMRSNHMIWFDLINLKLILLLMMIVYLSCRTLPSHVFILSSVGLLSNSNIISKHSLHTMSNINRMCFLIYDDSSSEFVNEDILRRTLKSEEIKWTDSKCYSSFEILWLMILDVCSYNI